ncbi:MAG TPA: hypothetical protein VK031_09470 [Tissierellaceae bacterium]|nr:hypothetical protein [Tissierellaceae bacterium]
MSENNCSTTSAAKSRVHDLSNKFDKISGKVVTIGVSVLIALMSMLYTDMKDRVNKMEERVTFLYNDKLSRSEFLDTMREIKEDMLLSRKETDKQIQSVKTEIIERLDLILQYNRDRR